MLCARNEFATEAIYERREFPDAGGLLSYGHARLDAISSIGRLHRLLFEAGRDAASRLWQMGIKSWPNSDLRRHTDQLEHPTVILCVSTGLK